MNDYEIKIINQSDDLFNDFVLFLYCDLVTFKDIFKEINDKKL